LLNISGSLSPITDLGLEVVRKLCDNGFSALTTSKHDRRRGVKNCVTSLMDGPLRKNNIRTKEANYFLYIFWEEPLKRFLMNWMNENTYWHFQDNLRSQRACIDSIACRSTRTGWQPHKGLEPLAENSDHFLFGFEK